MSEGRLPPVEEWPDWNDQPLGANPMEQDINAPYNKVSIDHHPSFTRTRVDLDRVT